MSGCDVGMVGYGERPWERSAFCQRCRGQRPSPHVCSSQTFSYALTPVEQLAARSVSSEWFDLDSVIAELGIEEDDEDCHCGQAVAFGYDGDQTHHRGMCAHCDSVRCDAYPGDCRR